MDMFFTEKSKNEWTVNFGPVNENLLGLGHFKAITQKFNQVSVTRLNKKTNTGSLNINASPNKPGYRNTSNGKYLSILNGDIIKAVTNDNFLQKDLITDFQSQSPLKNKQYVHALKQDPEFKREDIFAFAVRRFGELVTHLIIV